MTKNLDLTVDDDTVAIVGIGLDGIDYHAKLVQLPGAEPLHPRIAAQILRSLADTLDLEDINPEDITGG